MTAKRLKASKDKTNNELASCVLFALGSFRNAPVYDGKAKRLTTWHRWFKEALIAAGYDDLPQVQDAVGAEVVPPPRRKKARAT